MGVSEDISGITSDQPIRTELIVSLMCDDCPPKQGGIKIHILLKEYQVFFGARAAWHRHDYLGNPTHSCIRAAGIFNNMYVMSDMRTVKGAGAADAHLPQYTVHLERNCVHGPDL